MAMTLRGARPKLDADFPTVERAELALRIAELGAARATLARLDDLHEHWAEEARHADAVQAAEVALKAAEADEVDAAVEHLRGGTLTASRVDAARAALAAATRSQAIYHAAHQRVQAEDVPKAKAAVQAGEKAVRQAAMAVIRAHPGFGDLVDRVERLQRELLAASAPLLWLFDTGILPCDDGRNASDAEALGAAARARISLTANWQFITGQKTEYAPAPVEYGGHLMRQISQPWASALETLQQDANAPLPVSSST